MIVGIIWQKPVLTHASIIFEGMLASVNSVKKQFCNLQNWFFICIVLLVYRHFRLQALPNQNTSAPSIRVWNVWQFGNSAVSPLLMCDLSKNEQSYVLCRCDRPTQRWAVMTHSQNDLASLSYSWHFKPCFRMMPLISSWRRAKFFVLSCPCHAFPGNFTQLQWYMTAYICCRFIPTTAFLALPSAHVVQWSNHLGAMCSRAWRSQWPRIDSSLGPGASAY